MREYFSKILLFGEYSVLLGSQALVMPYYRFSGRLADNKGNDEKKVNDSQKVISTLLQYIEVHIDEIKLPLNVEAIKKDVSNGIYFDSRIPQQYGLGSSGALCAAIYEKYAGYKENGTDLSLIEVKRDLSVLESFFHEKSSGSDPLCSLLNKPLLMSSVDVEVVSIPKNRDYDLFLVDSMYDGDTGSLMRKFKQRWEDQQFVYNLMGHYIPLNDRCIKAFLQKGDDLFDEVFELSYFQLDNFTTMIPSNMRELWKDGLQNDLFSLKLCGSGGGGFFLGFTYDFQEVQGYFNDKHLPCLLI